MTHELIHEKNGMPARITGRRHAMQCLGLAAAGLYVPGAYAQALVRTPRSTEGPFYPDKFPLDTDNDLIIINNKLTPAVGEVTYLQGKVMDLKGNPVKNALVEIWQVDANGAYLHSGSDNRKKFDTNFQGYGRFLTSQKGEYFFRTIKPVTYPGRTPHIHIAVTYGGKRVLTSQLYIKGHPQNKGDFLINRLQEGKVRDSVMVDFKAIPAQIPQLKGENVTIQPVHYSAVFNIVVGLTPEDPDGFQRRRNRRK